MLIAFNFDDTTVSYRTTSSNITEYDECHCRGQTHKQLFVEISVVQFKRGESELPRPSIPISPKAPFVVPCFLYLHHQR